MIIFVGEAPSRDAGARSAAFSGRTGQFMAAKFGRGWRSTFDAIVNLIQEPQRKSGKGSHFPLKSARTAAKVLVATVESLANDSGVDGDCMIVAAGRRVFEAFMGRKSQLYFEPAKIDTSRARDGFFDWHELRVVCVPHPSGVNRWWNDAKNVAKARRFFASLNEVES